MFCRWLDRTPNAPFVAHNAGFYHGFISRALADCGVAPYRGPVLCTRKLGHPLVALAFEHGNSMSALLGRL